MVVAVIIAGGVGSRLGSNIPKQFVHVSGKPVLVYTMEAFQRHPLVDEIHVVCIDGWQDCVRAYARQFGVTKLKSVVLGGGTCQESIRNGVFALEGRLEPDDLVVIHDGVRPILDADVLDDVIIKAGKLGNAVTSLPYNEQIFIVDSENPSVTSKYIPRETIRRVSTPQCYRFELLDGAYHEAFEKGIGIHGSSYTNTMMVELGHTLNFAAGSDRNIKLTTQGDLAIFEAYVQSKS